MRLVVYRTRIGGIQMNHLDQEYLADLEWLKEAAEEMLDEYLAGELGKPCRVLLEEDAVCRDECYTDCAARRLQTVLKKLGKDKKKPEWDSLLTDEEKELLKGVRCSKDLRTMHPEDVKIIAKHIKEMMIR